MRQYLVRYTRIPTNYNPQESMLVEAESPEDARELVRRELGEDRRELAKYFVEKAQPYNPRAIKGKIINSGG